jgi:putative Holliday junction resolvase
MGRIAAIDYGLKRIGLAMTDKEKKIALPVGLVEGGKKAAMNVVQALPIKEVELLLIGLPLLMNGQKGDMALLVEKFAQDLETIAKVPILLWDERLSSKQADSMLREISLNRKARSEKIDIMAATLLLQSYLNSL